MAKKTKKYGEADLIEMFGLKRLVGGKVHSLMQEWTSTSCVLNSAEQYLFDHITQNLFERIDGWNEEMLKMNFISPVLFLGHIAETDRYKNYYESLIEATTAEGHFLRVKTDMMIADGILDKPKTPYFYFQEYKKAKDPQGDVTAQVLEAFLIADAANKDANPRYGCTVIGKYWQFMVMENRAYCISKTYDCTETDGLMGIIAILRKFKEILETRLLPPLPAV